MWPGASAFRLAFAQPYMGKRGVSEHAIWNQPIARAAISSCQIVTYDTKIVFGYVRELWAAGAFPEGPDTWRTRLQPVIHANVAATVEFNADIFKSDSAGVRNASDRDQDVTTVNVLLTGGCANDNCNLVSRSPAYLEQLGLQENTHTFVAENAPPPGGTRRR